MQSLPDVLALPYLTLVAGTIGSLLLFLSTDRQIKGLREALKLQRMSIADVETRSREGAAPQQPRESPQSRSTRSSVLDLQGRGYSLERIAAEAGLTHEEVDFILRVDKHVAASDETIAIGKIS